MVRARLLKKIALAAFVGLALVIALELLLRGRIDDGWTRFPLPPFGTFSEPDERERLERELQKIRTAHVPVRGRFDAELGWRPVPGVMVDLAESGTINSIRARSTREYPERRAPDSLRLACFGDSYVYGAEVEDADSWPAQLESLAQNVEAMNFGVNGYGTDQALLRFRRLAGELDAQVVVMGFLLENVKRNVSRYTPFRNPNLTNPVVKPRFVLTGGELELVPIPYASRSEIFEACLSGELFERVSQNDYWAGDEPFISGSALARVFAGWRAARRRNHLNLLAQPTREPWQVTLAILETFCREARAAGAEEALVLVFPTAQDHAYFARHGVPDYYQACLADLAARDIDFIDFVPILREAGVEEPLYLEQHFSPAGNRVVAERVLDRVRSSE